MASRDGGRGRARHTYPPEPGQIDELRVELSPRVKSLSSLQSMIETFGSENQIADGAIFLINLEIDELLTNYVRHSVHMIRHPRMEVRVRLFEDRLVLIVIDTGPPFNPLTTEDPDLDSGIDDRQPGGLGLHIVKSYADRMQYEEVNGCNLVRLEHDVKHGIGEDEGASNEERP